MTQEIHTAYKLVRVDRDAYASISFSEGDAAYVRYQPGQWVRAPAGMRKLGYDLCVFQHRNYVRDFVTGSEPPPDWEVWRCEAQGLSTPRVPSLGERLPTTIVRAVPIGAWPMGTLFAHAVRLVERIPWDHELLRREVLS
jgi:hypothetical protein